MNVLYLYSTRQRKTHIRSIGSCLFENGEENKNEVTAYQYERTFGMSPSHSVGRKDIWRNLFPRLLRQSSVSLSLADV